MFGGSKNLTFIYDTTEPPQVAVSPPKTKIPSIKLTYLKNSPLCADGYFCYDSDYIARIFGNFLYAVDGHSYNLHVFQIKDKSWNFSPLTELGIINSWFSNPYLC